MSFDVIDGSDNEKRINYKNIGSQSRLVKLLKAQRELPDLPTRFHPDVRARIQGSGCRYGASPITRRFPACVHMIGWLRASQS